jgi:hypothetical protein
LYAGRNAFLVAGATTLRPGSKILVEILNKEGRTVYSAPVTDFLEGNSRLIQIEVYNDTPIGPGKLVILGCTATYLDGTPVPNEWKDKYNVRWVTDVIISPRVENKTPIRFIDPPDITVEEKFYVSPSASFFSQSVTQSIDVELAPKFFNVYQNGYTIKALGTSSYNSEFLSQGRLTGVLQFVGPNGAETASIDLPITKIYNTELAESEGTLIYTDKKTLLSGLIVSSSGQYTASISPYGEVIVNSNLQVQYNRLVTFDEYGTLVEAEQFNRDAIMSFAKIRLTDLSTISGEIYKTRISYKSATMPSNFEVLADIPLQVLELFAVDSGSTIAETGRFSEAVIDDYWYAATMSVAQSEVLPTIPNYYVTASVISGSNGLSIVQNDTFLLDSINATPETVSGSYVNNVSYFIGNRDLNEIVLFPRSEYTLAFNALVTNFSGSEQWAGPTPNMEVYLVPKSGSVKLLDTNPKGQLIGQLTPAQNFQRQNFERVEFNFKPEIIDSGEVGIRFVIYGGFWNIANVSLKPATEPFFSPDEASVLLPNDFKYDDLLTFKAEFLDVNNNSIGIETTSLPTYFTGSPALTLRDGVVARPNDLEINGLPIYQTLLQDHFTGLITGGLLLTSSDYSQAFTITAGAGFYVDNSVDPLNPVYKYVAWPDLTVTASAFPTSGALADYPRTNVAISLPTGEPTEPVFGLFTGKAILASNTDVVEQQNPFTSEDYRNYIVLGRLAHVNSTSIQRTLSLPLTVFARQYHWFDLAYNLGPINIIGNVYGPGGTDRTIEKTEGQTYRIGSNYKTESSFPDITTDPSTNPTTFAYRYRSGSPTEFTEQPITTIVTGSVYDNGTGTLAVVNNNQWTIQRIFFFGATRTTRIQYGQAVYNSRVDAAAGITTEIFETDRNLAADAVFRGYLLVRGGAVNLSDLNDAEFIEVSSGFAGASGGGGATTLEALSDVDAAGAATGDLIVYNATVGEWVHTPRFPYSGSAVITGSLHVTGSVTASSYIVPQAIEPVYIINSGMSGTVNFDIMSSSVVYYNTDSTGNWTLNVRGSATTALNSIMTTGQSITMTLITTNGATPYSQSAFQIDGSAVTPKWQGTSAPTGNANANDIYSFSIIKTANATFTVFGSKTPFA